MRLMKTRFVTWLSVVLMVAGLAFATPVARPDDNDRPLELPSPLCDKLQVPPGNKVAYHVYARGVQIYRWDGETWVFVAPVATLFADPDFNSQVGIHYAGPRWESNSGSIVRAANPVRCDLDKTKDIPWLRLEAVSTEGPGIFSSVTYIHRVNTAGGVSPSAQGSSIGESVEIPYTAEYYFYRAEN